MFTRRRIASGGVATLVAFTVLWISSGSAYAGCQAGSGNGDARIRKGSGDYIGVGIFNCSGFNQQITNANLAPGKKYTADARIKNDGNGPTGITVEGDVDPNDEQDFKIRFLKPNGKDVTEKVLAAELFYAQVPEGSSTPRLQIVVKARDTADPGDEIIVSVWGYLGDNSPASGDTVIASGALPI